jgi:hypothetical protein
VKIFVFDVLGEQFQNIFLQSIQPIPVPSPKSICPGLVFKQACRLHIGIANGTPSIHKVAGFVNTSMRVLPNFLTFKQFISDSNGDCMTNALISSDQN